MPYPRPSAWASIGVLVTALVFSAFGPALAAEQPAQIQVADPNVVCTPGQLPTKWLDEFHPPNTIRVLRSKGPNAGRVEVVNFWDYVGVVLRAEYSTGADKPPLWMRIGAITVKQYGWYKAMMWGGGRITFLNPDGVTSTTQCYDVKDTTADQIYKPVKWDSASGTWIPGSVPTPANLKAMRETWHITLRKWVATKNKSRLFLTGYRSGRQQPCGADSTGYKIYQKSLRDCGVKNLTMYETLREYFEPNLYIVDTRGHDTLADSGNWRGDLGILAANGGSTQSRLYPGNANGFDSPVVNNFDSVSFSSIKAQGPGDVDGDGLVDLLMLTDGGSKLRLASSNGNGFGSPVTTDLASAATDLLVADFNGDLLADAGLLRTTGPGTASLQVMRSQAGGTFAAPTDWWSGSLDLASVFVAAGDVNGDGKADLVSRDATGTYSTAISSASCSALTSWGLCPAGAIGAIGLGAAAPALQVAWSAADVKNVIGDYDRDGRDDVIAVVKDGSGIKVFGIRAKTDGTFADPQQLWSGAIAFSDVQPVALDVNPDGLADLALVQKNGSNSTLTWLRSVERSTAPASMVPTTPYTDTNLTWNVSNRPF